MHAGTRPGLSYSLQYAPPEVVAAVEARQPTLPADAAVDMWALGVIACAPRSLPCLPLSLIHI